MMQHLKMEKMEKMHSSSQLGTYRTTMTTPLMMPMMSQLDPDFSVVLPLDADGRLLVVAVRDGLVSLVGLSGTEVVGSVDGAGVVGGG